MDVCGQGHAPAALTTGETVRGIPCIGGRVDPRTGLNAVEKRNISCSCQESEAISPAVKPRSLVTIVTELPPVPI
jgi:hypothetical protein